MPDAELAKKLDRPESAIRSKRLKLALHGPSVPVRICQLKQSNEQSSD